MTAPVFASDTHHEGDGQPRNRIWLLEYGPCWCRSHPTESSSFDYVSLRQTTADLGGMVENLLIVSSRVVDGASHIYRNLHSKIPDPRLVLGTAPCPAADQFWEELPNGWSPVEEVIPIDVQVDECIRGNPESLLAAALAFVLTRYEPIHETNKKVSLGG